MSRIGNKAITIPEGVTVTVENNHIVVKGPKGTLERDINRAITVKVEDNQVKLSIENKADGNLHGLTRTLINNMIIGTHEEFTRTLEINGVGYRAQKQGQNLVMSLGYSHQVTVVPKTGITFDVPDANTIIVKGIDKELVGQTAAEIREKRKPEVYKGKGIKYQEEHIRRKEGKTGKK